MAPLALWWPPAARTRRAVRLMLRLGAAGACAVSLLQSPIGITRLYSGGYVWCLALVLLAVGFSPGRYWPGVKRRREFPPST